VVDSVANHDGGVGLIPATCVFAEFSGFCLTTLIKIKYRKINKLSATSFDPVNYAWH
jgi:hypothetical protein